MRLACRSSARSRSVFFFPSLHFPRGWLAPSQWLHNSSVFDTLPNSRWITTRRRRRQVRREENAPRAPTASSRERSRRCRGSLACRATCKLPLPEPRRASSVGSLPGHLCRLLSISFCSLFSFFFSFSATIPPQSVVAAARRLLLFHAVVCMRPALARLVGYRLQLRFRPGADLLLGRFESSAPVIMFRCCFLAGTSLFSFGRFPCLLRPPGPIELGVLPKEGEGRWWREGPLFSRALPDLGVALRLRPAAFSSIHFDMMPLPSCALFCGAPGTRVALVAAPRPIRPRRGERGLIEKHGHYEQQKTVLLQEKWQR